MKNVNGVLVMPKKFTLPIESELKPIGDALFVQGKINGRIVYSRRCNPNAHTFAAKVRARWDRRVRKQIAAGRRF